MKILHELFEKKVDILIAKRDALIQNREFWPVGSYITARYDLAIAITNLKIELLGALCH